MQKSDDGKEQHCYFNIRTNDKLRNTFISKTLKNISSHTDSIQFQIEQLVRRNENNKTCDATLEQTELLNMISYADCITIQQLKYCTIKVSRKKYKQAVSEML